eukprot:TRINITY_DN5447_c0_g1_i1.p1 TRINITY_DN5447_c0_g1~~TRINITY_DN5447_c0_g1_i1.p1  ORF type:complete len:179 (+),score=11.17 TRINITY_DN5447_c0_g1_i1:138-674(+)
MVKMMILMLSLVFSLGNAFECLPFIVFNCTSLGVSKNCGSHYVSMCTLDPSQVVPSTWILYPPAITVGAPTFEKHLTLRQREENVNSACSILKPGLYNFTLTNGVLGFYDLNPDHDSFTYGYCMYLALLPDFLSISIATLASLGTWKPVAFWSNWVANFTSVSMCLAGNHCSFVRIAH